jgi:hypothetical protein
MRSRFNGGKEAHCLTPRPRQWAIQRLQFFQSAAQNITRTGRQEARPSDVSQPDRQHWSGWLLNASIQAMRILDNA